HAAVVGDVVAVVVHRRREERRHPDDVDPQPREVVEALEHAAQVADAVAVGVGEGAQVDLVADRPAPPVAGRVACGGHAIPAPLPRRSGSAQATRPVSAHDCRSGWAGTTRTVSPYSPVSQQSKPPWYT